MVMGFLKGTRFEEPPDTDLRALKSVSSVRLPTRGYGNATGLPRIFAMDYPTMAVLPTDDDYNDAILDAERSSLIMICVEWIATMFPLATWELQNKVDGAWQPVGDHPVLDLLDSPTPWHSGADLLTASMIDWCFWGEGYWILVGIGDEPSELWWRPASSMTPKRDSRGYLSHYEYRVDGQTETVEADDVFQFRRRQSADNPWRGVSPLSSLGKEIWTDTQAAIYSAAMSKNLGMPGWIASPKQLDEDDEVDDDDLQTTRQYLKDEYAGSGRGKPLLLDVPMDIHRLAFNPNEMHIKGLHDYSEQRVCGMFRLPAAVVQFGTGLEQTTENATLTQYEKQAWLTGLKPIHLSIAMQVSRSILPLFALDVRNWRLRFNFDGIEVLQENQDKVTDRNVKRLRAGGITRYQFLEAEGLPAVDTDHVWLLPSSIQEIPSPDFPEAVLKEREAKALEMAQGGNDDDPPPRRSVSPIRARRVDRLLARYNRSTRRITEDFTDLLVTEFTEFGKMAGRTFRRVNSERSAVRQLSGEDEELAREVLGRMNIRDWQNEVMRQKIGEPLTLRTLTSTIDDLSSVLSLEVNIPDPVMRRVIADGGTRLLGIDIAGQARKDLFSALLEGREKGEGVDDLVERISGKVARGRFKSPVTRAQVIARTETMHAQNVSTMTAYEHLDEIQRVEAKDNQIGFDDDDCSERDGQVFTIAEAKAISDHPNGTLLWLPVL